ncbi:hypothetical protein [Kaistella antarctica]|uniref:Uncharacterized protein n=1 Tax=Kaistella antarctica TaxID=266748 RepID=A0A448NUA2_9FLAO|nr:hypothetical protein [Kaistella antarctica]KEY18430.1 hypothetical protein HY04_07900 [Kaistella antarctica]SEV85694.1 hypothetical protein SAMN05421765_0793 [Kaistella antarctica]VEI01187.1 Uncharacterised protein [Kaistella antarctica]
MRKLFLLLTFFILIKVEAQFFSGEILIRDKSIYYLNQVYVTNITAQKTVYTDYFGTFKIPAKPGDVIRFTSIVTDRKDVAVTADQLETGKNIVELKIAYYDIQEVVISKFKPTGNLRKDVTSLKTGEKALALQKVIGLPVPKGDGTSPQLPVAGFNGGGLTFNLESIFDILSGERKKQERAQQYEKMNLAVSNIKNYYGEAYFANLKIPVNLIDNFLQFVYSSDNISTYVQTNNYEAVGIYIDKYLPIYQRRLKNSSLMSELK